MKVLLNQQVAQTKLLKNNLSNDNSDIKNAQTMSEVSLKEMPDKRDIVSFKALTKAKLKGFDLAMVEKLKAPLQNFRDVEHIQTWAGARFISLSFDKVKSRTKQIAIQKNAILKEWYDYLEKGNSAYSNTMKYLVYSSILAGVSADDDKLPPVLNKGVLADTITQIEEELLNNPKTQFNFNRVYITNLKKIELKDEKKLEGLTGWVIIPSYANDPQNFNANVKKLQNLSHDNWCTKSFNAKPYLKKGDFHIYLEDGNPKLGVRFSGDTVVEIEGEENNQEFPAQYFDVFKAHQLEYKLKLSGQAESEINHLEKVVPFLNKIKDDIGDVLEVKCVEDAQKIFDYLGVKYEKNSNNLLVLKDGLKSNYDGVAFSDIECNEQALIDYVEKIEGDAVFTGGGGIFNTLKEVTGNVTLPGDSNLVNLGTLKRIGGNLIIEENFAAEFGNLEYIGGNIENNSEYIEDVGNVKEIGGDINLSQFKSVKGLEKVGGNVVLKRTTLRSLDTIKNIGGNLIIEDVSVSSLNGLEYIGGDLYIEDTDLTSFGRLKTVKGNVEITDAAIEDFGELEYIGGNLVINQGRGIGSAIRDSELKEIGGNAFIEDSIASDIDFYNIDVKGKLCVDDPMDCFI